MLKRLNNKRKALILLVGIFLHSCSMSTGTDIVVATKQQRIIPEKTIIQSEKVFSRTRESASLNMVLDGDWSYGEQSVMLGSGNRVIIRVVLIDDNNDRHTANGYGQQIGGGIRYYCAYFSEIKRDVRIVKVEISATSELLINKIIWHCHDPI